MNFSMQTAGQVVGSAIPKELLGFPQWVAWWSVKSEGRRVQLPNGNLTKTLKAQAKPHKLPIDPSTGGLASTTNSRTWSTSESASACANRYSLTGIGFVFCDSDPYTGIDIDKCRDPKSGQIEEWAWTIIRALDSYTEISPSGTGVHILVRGSIPAGKGNQTVVANGKVEIFSRGRYFTFTGLHLEGTPAGVRERAVELSNLHAGLFPSSKHAVPQGPLPASTPAPFSDEELIERAKRARNGRSFTNLWVGDWKEYPSQSEADLALCSHLAFWTDSDAIRIDRLFRKSGLMRDKWNQRGYGQRTIAKALANGREGPGRKGPGPRELRRRKAQELSAPDLLSFPHTDSGNAERLVRRYGDDLRFCIETRKWMAWDGKRWTSEDSRRVRTLFKKTIREMHAQAADIVDTNQRDAAERHARQSESCQRIRAALECAECEDEIGVSANALDSEPFLLNCNNGTVNLQSGKLREHDRKDLITRLIRVDYIPGALCTNFRRFLYRIMGGQEDPESANRLISYLQKCFGHALTADVSEKAIFCFFGGGNNGKTTLLETIRFILYEYSAQILIDSLMAHPTGASNNSAADLADLRGARFVTSSETESGQKLAVARLKYLTQGMGEIRACRKYENPIVFRASHKLFLDANHRPAIMGSETAIWNRLKAIPFLVTIPPEEMDKGLPEKLKLEAEGILAWMVEGCLAWRREGLGDPPEVTAAISCWRSDSDRFRAFLQECFVIEPSAWVPVKEPWLRYQAWCTANHEDHRLNKTAFDQEMKRQGFKSAVRQNATVRAWQGLRAAASPYEIDKVTRTDGDL